MPGAPALAAAWLIGGYRRDRRSVPATVTGGAEEGEMGNLLRRFIGRRLVTLGKGTGPLGAALVLTAVSNPAAAASCAPESITLDRGEVRRLVICADAVPEDYVLTPPPGIAVAYQERLRHCGVGDRRPGLHLVLEASDTAASGTLILAGRSGAVPACEPIRVTVPARLRLPDGDLRRDGRNLRLELRVPRGVDLSPSCEAGPSFPPSDGLTLAVAGDVGGNRCSSDRLRWVVTPLDSRQDPAKIVLPMVRTADGAMREAVAYARAPAPAWLDSMRESDAKFLVIDGVRTRYFEKGRGEALVLVHGGQPSSMDGTAWDWQQNFDGLARHFHVFALDRLGQGYTDNPADLDDYRDYYPRVVRHVRGFIEAMGLRRVHLVGHSQGSWPVTRIALDRPDLVVSLTLVDGTMVAPPRDAGSAIRFYLYLSQDLHPTSGETAESARRGMEFFSYTRNNLTAQRIGRLVAMTRQPKYAESRAWFAASGMSPAHPSFRALKKQLIGELEAGALEVPVLVVWGRDDPEGSLESGLELFRIVSASSPRARLHVFGRSGHLSFVEYPEEFNRVLTAFALGIEP